MRQHALQATAILTPLLAALSGEWPSRNVWLGCVLALGSTLLITLDSADPNHTAGSASLISVGESLNSTTLTFCYWKRPVSHDQLIS